MAAPSLPSKRLGILWIGKHLSALQVLAAMQPASQAKMTSQVCACFLEKIHHARAGHSRKDNKRSILGPRVFELSARGPNCEHPASSSQGFGVPDSAENKGIRREARFGCGLAYTEALAGVP